MAASGCGAGTFSLSLRGDVTKIGLAPHGLRKIADTELQVLSGSLRSPSWPWACLHGGGLVLINGFCGLQVSRWCRWVGSGAFGPPAGFLCVLLWVAGDSRAGSGGRVFFPDRLYWWVCFLRTPPLSYGAQKKKAPGVIPYLLAMKFPTGPGVGRGAVSRPVASSPGKELKAAL